MLNCKDASRLISDAMDRPLGLAQRAGLGLHLAICATCRRARVQMQWLRAAARRYPGAVADDPSAPEEPK